MTSTRAGEILCPNGRTLYSDSLPEHLEAPATSILASHDVGLSRSLSCWLVGIFGVDT